VEQTWGSESRDDDFSAAAKRVALAEFDDASIDSTVLLDVDCRNTLCRLRLDRAKTLPLEKLHRLAVERGVLGKAVASKEGVIDYYVPIAGVDSE
jgi:hypothetical protein